MFVGLDREGGGRHHNVEWVERAEAADHAHRYAGIARKRDLPRRRVEDHRWWLQLGADDRRQDQHLVDRLARPLPMNRFRPNIVLDGCAPYAEDVLDSLSFNGVRFDGMTLCLRCAITTTDQSTAERSKEPLRTLATYRRTPDGVTFGRNFNHDGEGTLRIGDRAK